MLLTKRHAPSSTTIMKNNKRRLLKDLPFDNLKVGTVVWKGSRGHGGSYSVSRGETFYESGGSSSNGIKTFGAVAEKLLDIIWDNGEWFEDADINHITIEINSNNLVLSFDHIDIEDATSLAKGIAHILPHLGDGSYTWKKFSNITARLK